MTDAVEPRGQEFIDTLSSNELVAYSRGQAWGAFLHNMEATDMKMSPEKSDEILNFTDGVILQPESLDLPVGVYNSLFSRGAREARDYFRKGLSSEDIENRAKFFERMSVFSDEDQLRIRIAYDLAKYSHRGTIREDRGRYFEHVRNTALIIFDECGIEDADMVIAALLHDVVEDETTFGPKKNLTTRQWMEEAGLRLDYIFGERVEQMVTAVTKPQIDEEEYFDRHDVKEGTLDQLRKAMKEASIIKMADRLHNLRTLLFRSKKDQIKVATETLELYLPILNLKALEYFGYSNVFSGIPMLEEIVDLSNQYLSNNSFMIIKGIKYYKWDGVDRESLIQVPYSRIEN